MSTSVSRHPAQVSLAHWQGSVYRMLSRGSRVHWPARIGILAVTACGPYSILQAARLDPADVPVADRCQGSGCRTQWLEFDATRGDAAHDDAAHDDAGAGT